MTVNSPRDEPFELVQFLTPGNVAMSMLLIGVSLWGAVATLMQPWHHAEPPQLKQVLVVLPPLPDLPVPAAVADLTRDQARASNTAVPIAVARVAPAPRFVWRGSTEDRPAAVACLATAVLYEAGDASRIGKARAMHVLSRKSEGPKCVRQRQHRRGRWTA